MPDIFDPLTPNDEVQIGDYLKVETEGNPGLKIEGEVNYVVQVGDAAGDFDLGDDSYFEVHIERAVIEKLLRRRPEVKLPTREGSAVLVYDVNFLDDVVLVLRRSIADDFSSELGWFDAFRGRFVAADQVVAFFTKTLFDAGKPRSA